MKGLIAILAFLLVGCDNALPTAPGMFITDISECQTLTTYPTVVNTRLVSQILLIDAAVELTSTRGADPDGGTAYIWIPGKTDRSRAMYAVTYLGISGNELFPVVRIRYCADTIGTAQRTVKATETIWAGMEVVAFGPYLHSSDTVKTGR